MAQSPVIEWILGGAGVLLIYSAHKQTSPLTVISGVVGGQQGPPTATLQRSLNVPASFNPAVPGKLGTVIAFALAQRGKPYSTSPDGVTSFDCSLLMQKAYAAAGIVIPRVTFDQVNAGFAVDKSQIQPGDLIFYEGLNESGQYVRFGHVAMALGGGMEIQAPHTGADVQVVPVNFNGIEAVRRYVT